ncbi:MAG: hypothetical protein Q8K72_14045, partial [Acidimicrobiales bacterium]|nr:hypothetical protein [Acidimicrobiales bacterium]
VSVRKRPQDPGICDPPGGAYGHLVPILHIQHAITDFDTWASAFNRFAEARRNADVRAHRVMRPVDDPAYVVIELDFDTAEAAEAFLGFLTTNVWGVPANSPGLGGTPETMVLEPAVL